MILGGAVSPVSMSEQFFRPLERVISETGRIDVLVNNAGNRVEKDVIDTTIEEWDRMMAVNLTAVFLGCNFCLPHMLAQGSGVIVNVASTSGLNPLPNRAAYCANKAGVIGLTKQMALQYARQGVRVTAICPGPTDTPFARKMAATLPDPEAAPAAYSARVPLRVLRRTLELVWGHGGRNVPLASNDALPEKYSQKHKASLTERGALKLSSYPARKSGYR